LALVVYLLRISKVSRWKYIK
jgi:hypothetical protein